MAGSLVRVTLRTTAKTVWGSRLGVVGGTPELGHWDCNKALVLTTDPATYPVWTGTFSANWGEPIQYKYVILVPSPDGKLEFGSWEEHANRRFTPAGSDVTITESLGGPTTSIVFSPSDANSFTLPTTSTATVTTTTTILPTTTTDSLPLSSENYQIRVKIGSFDKTVPLFDTSKYSFKLTPLLKELGAACIEGGECVFSAPTLEGIGFSLRVYSRGSDKYSKCVVTAKELSSLSGILVRPLFDQQLEFCGEIIFSYLVVTPFVHPKNDLKKRVLNIPAMIGHRGFGKNTFSSVAENTMLSFQTAHDMGLDCVEFDLHLSADKIPVVYHDFHVATNSIGGAPVLSSLSSLTLKQFKGLDKWSQNGFFTEKRSKLRRNSSPQLNRATRKWKITDRSYATYEQMLKDLPSGIAFDVEIKYPKYPVVPEHERNELVNTILQVTFDHVVERSLFFSSFDADICVLLARKQQTFPVFFLIDGKEMRTDRRTLTLQTAMEFVESVGLGGIICEATHLLAHKHLIPHMHEKGLKILSWGDVNNQMEIVKQQQDLLVDSIITDQIQKISPYPTRKNRGVILQNTTTISQSEPKETKSESAKDELAKEEEPALVLPTVTIESTITPIPPANFEEDSIDDEEEALTDLIYADVEPSSIAPGVKLFSQ